MDAKDLRIESVLGDRNDSNTSYSVNGATAPRSDKIKPLHEVSPTCVPKMDVQTVRPCAVIGPDRIIPQQVSTDLYAKKAQLDPWDYSENDYRKLPDYLKKVAEPELPSRNISPRQTFQESMNRITMPPRANLTKLSESPNHYYSEKNVMLSENIKYNIPIDYEVPYNINTVNNEQRSAVGIPEINVSQNNLAYMRNPHGWPTSVDSRQYVMPEAHRYAEYQNGSSRVVSVNHPMQTMHEDSSHLYADPYGRSGNLRFHPYPSSKLRLSTPRYDPYYSNRFDSAHFPPQHNPHRYSSQKTFISNPYISYPQVPVKYLEPRIHEPHLDGYQREPNHAQGFNLTYQGQSLLPNCNNNAGNCVTNKISYLDNNVKPLPSGKGVYENSNKVMMDPSQTKPISVSDHSYINEIRSNSFKAPILSHYPPGNVNSVPSYPPYYRNEHPPKGYGYVSHHSNVDHVNNIHPYTRIISTPHYSPTISHDSHPSNKTFLSHNYGNLGQNSSLFDRNVDYYKSKYFHQNLRKNEYGYGKFNAMSPKQNFPMGEQPKTDKKGIDVRQFLQMWNEGDEEHNDKKSFTRPNDLLRNEIPTREEELYVLGLVNVPNEELQKYDHIQKISKLPENIKGYNSFELLSQFEEVVEASNHTTTTPPIIPVKPALRPTTIKQTSNVVRPLSPLDVEAKITQSIIHKDCSFEIKPCSPKMLNVEIATPAQSILNERVIEKVTNPSTQPLNITKTVENILIYDNIKHTKEKDIMNISSCKMVKTSYLNDNSDHKSKYDLSDLENNSGVCLASLPQLDTDIEFNFTEVNQQFLAANKSETSNSIFDAQKCDSAPSSNDINSVKKEKTSNHTSEKSLSKLSKFRKTKVNIQENTKSNIDAQSLRTDSVIIKNPDNTEKCLDVYNNDLNIVSDNDISLNEKSLLSPINLSYQNKFEDSNKNNEENYLNCNVIENRNNTETSNTSLSSCYIQSTKNNDLSDTINHLNTFASYIHKDNCNSESKNCQCKAYDQLEISTDFNEGDKDVTKIEMATHSKSETYVCDQTVSTNSQNKVNLDLEINGNVTETNIPQYPLKKNIVNDSENNCIITQNDIEHFEVDAEFETMLNEDFNNLKFSEATVKNIDIISDDNIAKNNEGVIEKCLGYMMDSNKIETKDKVDTLNKLETSNDNKTTKCIIGNIPETCDNIANNKILLMGPYNNNKEIYSSNLKSSANLIYTKEVINENNISKCNSELLSYSFREKSFTHSSLKKELLSPRIQNLINNERNWYYRNIIFDESLINSQHIPKQESYTSEYVIKAKKSKATTMLECDDNNDVTIDCSNNSTTYHENDVSNNLSSNLNINKKQNNEETIRCLKIASNTDEKKEIVKLIKSNNSCLTADDAKINASTINCYDDGFNTTENKETIMTKNAYTNLNIYNENIDIKKTINSNDGSDLNEKKNEMVKSIINKSYESFNTDDSNVNIISNCNNGLNTDDENKIVKSNIKKTNLSIISNVDEKKEIVKLIELNNMSANINMCEANVNIEKKVMVKSFNIGNKYANLTTDESNINIKTIDSYNNGSNINEDKEIITSNIQNANLIVEAIDCHKNNTDKNQEIVKLIKSNVSANLSMDKIIVKNLSFIEEKYLNDKKINKNDVPLDVDNILLLDPSSDNIQLNIESVSNKNDVVINSNTEIQYLNKAIGTDNLDTAILQIVEIEDEKNVPLSCKKVGNKLKRSLSESSIFECVHSSNQYIHENVREILWHSKRRKINKCDNTDRGVNISRRKSISTIQNDNIAVCIYISNENCFVAQPESDLITNEICNSPVQVASVLNESSEVFLKESIDDCEPNHILTENLILNENNNLWVDDIACVETVVTDENSHEYSGDDTISEVEENSYSDIITNYDKSDIYPDYLNKYYCLGKNMIADKISNESPNLTLQNFYGLDNYSLKEKISLNNQGDNIEGNMHPSFNTEIKPNEYTVFQGHLDNFSNNIVGFQLLSPLKNDIDDESDDDNIKLNTAIHSFQTNLAQGNTLNLCESSNNDLNLQTDIKNRTSSSSSPEVTSTTEEKKSGIFLKITNYNGSRVSVVDNNNQNIEPLNSVNSCKLSECNYSDPQHLITKPLITKAAKKYIPPHYDYQDFRVKLYLPLQKLIKLKQLKTAKDTPKINPNVNKRMVQKDSKINIRKIKPNFEDVLKSIDELQFKQKSSKKVIPKVVIKKNRNGSHYASTSKSEFNPDLTGRKWQPWVFIEKNSFIDKMAIKNKKQAIYCHKNQMYTVIKRIKPLPPYCKSTKYCKNEKKNKVTSLNYEVKTYNVTSDKIIKHNFQQYCKY